MCNYDENFFDEKLYPFKNILHLINALLFFCIIYILL